MKVLDLQCSLGHCFEGWFGSQIDYDTQRAQGMVTCPVCSDSDITKMLSAPRLNLGQGMEPVTTSAQSGEPNHALAVSGPQSSVAHANAASEKQSLQQMQAAMLSMVRHVMANTEDVGPQFAEEARKIHYGEREERHIRGQATREETEALLEEGIDILPLPVHLKGPLQ